MGSLFSKKCKDDSKKKDKKEKKKGKKSNGTDDEPESPNGAASGVSNGGTEQKSQPGDSGGSANSNHKVRVKALYKFDGVSEDDLSFNVGDIMEVEEHLLEKVDDWWWAVHMTTKMAGYIPGNYVVRDDSTPQSKEWWHSVDRREADKMLLLPGNKNGTFLVRTTKEGDNWALSVLAIDSVTNEPSVRHYKIKKLDNSESCFITASRTFSDLIALVDFYRSRESTGLCCPLTDPVPRIRPNIQWRQLEVSREAVKLSSKLGAGFFGEVWKGKFRKVVDVAVKTLKPGTMSSEAFLAEAKIMHNLTHPRLVQLVAVVSDSQPFFIITELMANGSLLDFLHSDQGRALKLPHLIEMNCQIAEGMTYLEAQKNIHRDLRAANVLVGEHFDVKIADFGLARIMDDEIYEANENAKFPVKWTAPEAATRHEFSIKSDVWSFGVLMYEIITLGRLPYTGMNGREVINMVERGGRMDKPRGPPECPDEYYEMMLKCWHQSPEDRPTFEYIFDFFSDYSVSIEKQYNSVE